MKEKQSFVVHILGGDRERTALFPPSFPLPNFNTVFPVVTWGSGDVSLFSKH